MTDQTEDIDSFHSYDDKSDNAFEIAVDFVGTSLGFALSSNNGSFPFVSKLLSNGNAQRLGVILGDNVIAVNGVKIEKGTPYKAVVDLIQQEKEINESICIVFKRSFMSEMHRRQLANNTMPPNPVRFGDI